MRAAFLDRDDTINRDYPDEVWTSVREPELLPGAVEGMLRLMQLGYRLFIITNQYVIGENFVTREAYEHFSGRLLELLEARGVQVERIYHCPHRRDEGCGCCKPRPGMILQALADYPEIDLARSFMAGDSWRDRELARGLKLRFFGIGMEETDYGQSVASLREAADILKQEDEP